MVLLEDPVRDYAWGSHHVLAELQGRPAPTDRPEAELWVGTHPAAPSRVRDDGRLLAELLVAEPRRLLGSGVVGRFGEDLPFLLKVLAIAAPLSLQAHPDDDQARAGFADEEARGILRDAPERTYRDASAKPELLVALSPVTALCGLRPAAATAELLASLGTPQLDEVVAILATGDDALPLALRRLLTWPVDERGELVAAFARGADHVDDPARARWLRRLAELHPADPGVVVAAFLHLVELAPGEAIHLPAGELHAYLEGTGVEVMATSDNVLRGGLTDKHVDVDGLLGVLTGRPSEPPRVAPCPGVPGEQVYPTPTPAFRLSRLAPGDGEVVLDERGVQLLLVTDGEVRVHAGSTVTRVGRGRSALVAATAGPVRITGRGTVFRATVGDEDADEHR
ncbi:mannose-6-phosphate isomerase, class I [Nitriliruptoraceae bacterium ZYF776]|nr:mannose-6-phosphate isomerase, class I [Profundirhabdus halotolerans]